MDTIEAVCFELLEEEALDIVGIKAIHDRYHGLVGTDTTDKAISELMLIVDPCVDVICFVVLSHGLGSEDNVIEKARSADNRRSTSDEPQALAVDNRILWHLVKDRIWYLPKRNTNNIADTMIDQVNHMIDTDAFGRDDFRSQIVFDATSMHDTSYPCIEVDDRETWRGQQYISKLLTTYR